jgi:hypothetical protein
MVRKKEYEDRGKNMNGNENTKPNTNVNTNANVNVNANASQNGQKGYGQRPPREQGQPRENLQHTRDNSQHPRENSQYRSFHRENSAGQGYSHQSPSHRHVSRSKSEETADDIRTDILRIEKEIDLEIMEIKSLKL